MTPPGRLQAIRPASGGMNFTVLKEGKHWGEFFLPMVGEHNVLNALAALAVLAEVGAEPQALKEVLPGFQGVKKRQEVAGEFDGILVLEDFAHHPTAVGVTLAAVRQAYPTRRLVAAFEPRTNTSRRKIFQEPYAAAFKDADLILLQGAAGPVEGGAGGTIFFPATGGRPQGARPGSPLFSRHRPTPDGTAPTPAPQ